MAKKNGTICVVLEFDFTYDDTRTSFDMAAYIASDLAMNPNFGTIENGVQLTDIRNLEGFDI